MEIWELLQWPAMVVTVLASWLMTSTNRRRRCVGFACLLLSNVLWVGWGLHAGAYAVIALQFCLAALNIRGLQKNSQFGQGMQSPDHQECTR